VAVVHWAHGRTRDTARAVSQLLALAAFALVGSITPGPNNALLLGSGIRFGFLRTAPHVVGTAVGMAVLVFAVAGGVGVALLALPGAELALKLVGSAYLLYLAVRIAGGGAGGAVVSRPLGVLGAVAFQLANPKGWLFALTAAATFLPPGRAPLAGGLIVAATCAVVILGSAAVWAAGGVALGRVAGDGRLRRGINLALALVLAASVALVWT
jgi:threonine/homoserine/homoserine lactone efflux protein